MLKNSNYYAIIPADVRYDNRLKPNAKLMYGEFTCLCNIYGYCFATNKYFAELYNVSTNTISEWINQLKRYGYINVSLIYKENSKEIQERRIYLRDSDHSIKKEWGYHEKSGGGIPKKREDNNTSINNTRNNIIPSPETGNPTSENPTLLNNNITNNNKTNIIPTLQEVEDYITAKKYNVVAHTFFNYYETLGWKDKNGKEVKNWKLKLLTWHNHSPVTNEPLNNKKRFKDYE